MVELQQHLDRHDRALGHGVSLLQSQPHPWIEQHRVRHPPKARDQVVSMNGRIAAWLTQRLGSMWTFYTALLTQVVWIGLAMLGVQRFDRYPFLFMTFLSTLAQLITMLVIMVGQDVLSRAADRRSEQTFLDARAILHECRRMRQRLTAQDRLINSLCDYTTVQVTERLARAIHRSYLQGTPDDRRARWGAAGDGLPALRGWDELPEDLKEANRAQARHVGEKLAMLGYVMVPVLDDAAPAFRLDESEVRLLARAEHERWMAERIAAGYRYGPRRDGRFHPDLVPWKELPDPARDTDVRAVRAIPDLLADEGFQVIRVGPPDVDHARN